MIRSIRVASSALIVAFAVLLMIGTATWNSIALAGPPLQGCKQGNPA